MKSFASKPSTFGMRAPKALAFGGGNAKGKLKMPSAAHAPATAGTKTAKGFGVAVKTFGTGVGAEPATGILQKEHTSAHH